MNSGKLLLGVLAGIAVGATLGILFAPAKGTATRKMISQKSDDYAEGLGEKFNDFVNDMSDKMETMKEDVVRMADHGKVKIADAIVGMNSNLK